MTVNYSALKKKEVLEVSTGKNLGKISDLVIDCESGKILKIVVPGKKSSFLSCESLEISFKNVVKIGDDVIIVELCSESDCLDNKRRKLQTNTNNACCDNQDEFEDDC